MIVASWGWGRNSTWMIVKAIERGYPPDVILSMDTGIEHPDTYCTERWYVENIWKPAGIQYVRLTPATHPQYYDRRIAGRSLLQFCRDRHIVPLAASRWCSSDWKAKPGDRWMNEHGATENWLGFTDEEEKRVRRRGCYDPFAPFCSQPELIIVPQAKRKRKRDKPPTWRLRAPLWEDGDTLYDCQTQLETRGLLVPDKSGCVICPFSVRALLAAARAGNEQAIEHLQIVIELETQASLYAGRPVGLHPDGIQIKEAWETGITFDLDIPAVYRPCECAV